MFKQNSLFYPNSVSLGTLDIDLFIAQTNSLSKVTVNLESLTLKKKLWCCQVKTGYYPALIFQAEEPFSALGPVL